MWMYCSHLRTEFHAHQMFVYSILLGIEHCSLYSLSTNRWIGRAKYSLGNTLIQTIYLTYVKAISISIGEYRYIANCTVQMMQTYENITFSRAIQLFVLNNLDIEDKKKPGALEQRDNGGRQFNLMIFLMKEFEFFVCSRKLWCSKVFALRIFDLVSFVCSTSVHTTSWLLLWCSHEGT